MWGMRNSSCLVLLLTLAVTFAGCGSESTQGEIPLAPTGARLDDHRWLGEPVTVANLTVWPVHTDRPLDVGEFLTLEEAERRGVAAVREVGGAERGGGQSGRVQIDAQQEMVLVDSNDAMPPPRPAADPEAAQAPEAGQVRQGGQARQAGQVLQGEPEGQLRGPGQVLAVGGAVVNTLVIENQGDLPILVCAGTIVKGGQQDRQIAQDFVIAAKATVPVDAFCVEAGRWSVHDGDGSLGLRFTNEEQGIAVKSVRASAQYDGDQSKVWTEVGKVLKAQSISGTTSFVAANEEMAAEVLANRKQLEQLVADHFASLADGKSAPVGFAYAVDGKPVTVRAFAHERLLRGHLPSFVKAMVLEAELAERGRTDGAVVPEASAADVVALVEALKKATLEERETSGMNVNAYRRVAEGFNGECRIRLRGVGPDKVVLTEDWTAK